MGQPLLAPAYGNLAAQEPWQPDEANLQAVPEIALLIIYHTCHPNGKALWCMTSATRCGKAWKESILKRVHSAHHAVHFSNPGPLKLLPSNMACYDTERLCRDGECLAGQPIDAGNMQVLHWHPSIQCRCTEAPSIKRTHLLACRCCSVGLSLGRREALLQGGT